MTKAVIFRNPGLAPIEAFTTIGVNVKPNTKSPIGFFGTGLKYVVAVLVRHGIKFRVFIGGVEYEFYSKKGNFRGTEIEYVMMRKRNAIFKKWSSVQLSYTTQHGKQWELWQVVRELQSNMLDEGGESSVSYSGLLIEEPRADETVIVVEGDKFAEVYETELSNIFLQTDTISLRDKSAALEVYNKPSKYLYYRGLRVYEMEKPGLYTYNFISSMDLTEDRTLKYVFYAKAAIARHVSQSHDEKLIHEIVSVKDTHFEAGVDFDFVYEAPSEEFMKVIKQRKRRGLYVGGSYGGFYSKYSPPLQKARDKMTLLEQWNEWLDNTNSDTNAELLEMVRKTVVVLQSIEEGKAVFKTEPVITKTFGAVDDVEIPF